MHTKIMGIVNVTPDSFSDGGRWFSHDDAIRHGQELVELGAEIIDVGGESTRPGSTRPSAEEEERRVIPVVEALSGLTQVSVDTMRATVAERAIEAGATIINDVSGGLADEQMFAVIADADVDYICQHWRGHGSVMNDNASYDDVVDDVLAEVERRVQAAVSAGIDPQRIIIDPGLGFGKETDHNWQLLAALERFTSQDYRVLVGASRKRFLQSVTDDVDLATAVVSAWSALHRAWAVRTHDVKQQRVAIDVATAIMQARDD